MLIAVLATLLIAQGAGLEFVLAAAVVGAAMGA
jgi:NAD(P) transhydrogenase subunit beta